MEKNNVINLVEYLEKKQSITPLEVKTKPLSQNLLRKRVYSFVIDVACIFTIKAAIDLCFLIFVTNFFHSVNVVAKSSLLMTPLWLHATLFIASYIGYFMFTQVTMSNQTIGQKVYGLKVYNQDGEISESFSTAFLRTIGYLSYYMGAGLFQLIYFSSEERRSFADIISSTYIQTQNPKAIGEVIEIDIENLNKNDQKQAA